MKNEPDPNRLLDDILEEISPPAFRAELLERTLKQVRHRRHVRQWNQRLLVTAVIVMAGVLAWRTYAPRSERHKLPVARLNWVSSKPLSAAMIVESNTNFLHTITSHGATVAMVQTQLAHPELRELNDDELLAMLGGRPAVLVRRTPHQAELLLVDAATEISRPVEEWGPVRP